MKKKKKICEVNSLRQWTYVPKVAVLLTVHFWMWCLLMCFAELGISRGSCQGWTSLKMFLKTLLWPLATLRPFCGSRKAYFSLFRFCINWVWSLCFLLSKKKKKILRWTFLEFSRISLKMKTHSVILCSYCCSHFAVPDSRQLRIFQHGLNFAYINKSLC